MGSDSSVGRKSAGKTDSIVKNDYAFLQEVKKANHTATVGGLDRRYQSKVANKKKRTDEENTRQEKEAQRTLAEHEECYDLNTSSNASETDSEADIIEESKTKCKQSKLSVLNPSVCAVADKHPVSHRALTEILSVYVISQGADLDDYAISTMKSKRTRDSVRSEQGEQSMQFLKQKVQQSKSFLLQWDGKMLTPLQHAKQKKKSTLLFCCIVLMMGKKQ